ncbi:DMT family transporter [Tropicibacter naphthalenivorans]|uniref:Carboxylate/amino acid/amine transporter n=1 Tax=Tropicibacter naphthalenivorans TaxID=441103 RepID=A0A0P1GVD2_9RHOB|nr:DMT family transporter [Tropicibacter naphthalenivorans]CUH79323.1 carboxylate/amino acid/amine transporter [Tropicibacter naphthalenivorans]SMC71323.1 EamA-like transporter family protein [Tropicibacter naphthalenivorans]
MERSPNPMLPSAAGRRAALSGNALAVASMLTWAAGFPAAELLLEDWPATSLIAARLGCAVAMLLPLWLLVDGPRAVLGARWGRGLLVGGVAFGLGTWLLLVAQDMTDAVTVAIILSASPIAAVLIEMLWDGRRLTRGFAIGIVATVLGGALATGGGGVALGAGALVAIAACFLFSWGSFAAVRDFPTLSPIGRTTLTLAGGFAATAVITLLSDAAGLPVRPTTQITATHIGLLAIYGIAGMALSQVMFIASIGRLGVAVASFHVNIVTFYVMLIMLALGGTWDWQAALGAGIVAVGVILAQRS